jgi:hypothetical protein
LCIQLALCNVHYNPVLTGCDLNTFKDLQGIPSHLFMLKTLGLTWKISGGGGGGE